MKKKAQMELPPGTMGIGMWGWSRGGVATIPLYGGVTLQKL
jgi:hypothetical protein